LTILSGTFTYLRRINDGDYNHREAKAEIAFATEEGADDAGDARVMDRAQHEAMARVAAMLGSAAPASAAAVQSTTSTEAKVPKPRPAKVPAEPATAVAKPATAAATAVAEPATAAAKPATAAAPRPAPKPVGDPMAGMFTPPGSPEAAAAAVAGLAPQPVEDPMADLLTSAPPAPVTDKQLVEAVTAKADRHDRGALVMPIRRLIGKYAGPPPNGIAEIPEATRNAFLTELMALEK
jgi:hypothetical protein